MTTHQRKHVRTRQQQFDQFLQTLVKVDFPAWSEDNLRFYSALISQSRRRSLCGTHTKISTNLSAIYDKQDLVQYRDLPGSNYLYERRKVLISPPPDEFC